MTFLGSTTTPLSWPTTSTTPLPSHPLMQTGKVVNRAREAESAPCPARTQVCLASRCVHQGMLDGCSKWEAHSTAVSWLLSLKLSLLSFFNTKAKLFFMYYINNAQSHRKHRETRVRNSCTNPTIVVHIFNPSSQEAETGISL